MQSNMYSRTATRLDKAYVCKKCGVAFLFVSDIEDHEHIAGHKDVFEITL